MKLQFRFEILNKILYWLAIAFVFAMACVLGAVLGALAVFAGIYWLIIYNV